MQEDLFHIIDYGFIPNCTLRVLASVGGYTIHGYLLGANRVDTARRYLCRVDTSLCDFPVKDTPFYDEQLMVFWDCHHPADRAIGSVQMAERDYQEWLHWHLNDQIIEQEYEWSCRTP